MDGREYHFRSMTPCGPLRVLSEWARQSTDVGQFITHQLTKQLSPVFDQLSAPDIFGSAEHAWRVLRGMWFEVGDEQQLNKTNAMFAAMVLEGAAESLLPIAVGDVLLENLRKRLTKREFLERLAVHGIHILHATAKRTARDEVQATSASWRRTVERELLKPAIPRTEADDLMDLMSRTRLALVVGSGGGGKSSVVYQAAGGLEVKGAEVLAFRLDRRGTFSSTAELGAQLGLTNSPVASLRLAADGRDAILIIDQLDAVSLASGRLSERYDVIEDLVHEAMSVEGVQVILACRLFDVENDHRIRKLDARNDVERLTVEPLSDEVVTGAVEAMGLDTTALTSSQRELLKLPLNLVLLETVASQPGALNFTSRGSLFEAFWNRKRQTIKDYRPEVRFNDVLARIARSASNQQALSVGIEILDSDDYISDAQVLASEQVLAIDDGRVSFFHETFFDYTFARQWLSREQSMVEFLCAQEQELFRRAQVRQILELLREREPARFRREVEAVLTGSAVRFHIKETVMIVFASVNAPTDEDLDLVLRISETDSTLARRLWQQISRPSWFDVLHDRGLIETWLDSTDQTMRERGIAWLANAGPDRSTVVSELLTARRDAPEYLMWLRWLTQRADLHTDRPLFDLLLSAVRTGDFDPADRNLWLSSHDLATHEPLWAIELLSACFVENLAALVTDQDGKVAILGLHDYGVAELIKASSKLEPRAFAEIVVPYLLSVMQTTSIDRVHDGLLYDHHFSLRLPTDAGFDNVDDALYSGAADALASWVSSAPASVEPLLRTLAASEHGSAQALLFRALIAGSVYFTDWAAELILEGGSRLESGYLSDIHWLSREVVEAIAPLVPDEVHARLEDELRDLRNPYEQFRSFGYTAFKFLSVLDRDRLSAVGTRRLAEYQRKFAMEVPPPPTGIISYTVGSPIGDVATGRMTNKQWLRAIAKHDNDDRGWDRSLGGARELSQVLKNRTVEDPLRFASLAMQMTATNNEAYPSAILWGFGEATIPSIAQPAVFDAIRHIMSLGLTNCDRWLGRSLRSLLDETPIDIVELVRDRAQHSPDPKDDSPVFTRQGDERRGRDLRQNGINTARGNLAEELGDLLVHDVHGERSKAVSPHLTLLASDPVLSVRSCIAHTIAASLRHARPTAYEAFEALIDADDILLASEPVSDLMIYIGNVDPERIDPVIDRMLESEDGEVRQAGGKMAAFAALQWERPQLMERALAGDIAVRTGAAVVCSARVGRAANSELVLGALRQLMHDDDDEVCQAVGKLTSHLRGKRLRPFASFLADLIASPSYVHATPQLLIALQEAPDKVDDLVELAAHRFLDVYGSEAADIRTGAAGDVRYISELVVRGLAQALDNKRISALLDILDRLLELGVYGVGRAIEHAERR
ncbi:nSTAND1 domain-containing NTPase [Arthrobacter psychrochitiniphilus]|uniref:nSTAND1 domain-containing NTPase n=1 Tax=Arthrobacter psychrochitiniphilus TaxID=291045 RepID=UPI003F7BC5D1